MVHPDTVRSGVDLARVNRAVAASNCPPAVFKTCPWQPRALVETGLRQWLRCAGAALRDGQVIGMPSHAVDEAWHGFILCTARYAAFCQAAYGRFLHHHPDGGGGVRAPTSSRARNSAARSWPGHWWPSRASSACCGISTLTSVSTHPWGVPTDRVAAVIADAGSRRKALTMAIPLQTRIFWKALSRLSADRADAAAAGSGARGERQAQAS